MFIRLRVRTRISDRLVLFLSPQGCSNTQLALYHRDLKHRSAQVSTLVQQMQELPYRLEATMG